MTYAKNRKGITIVMIALMLFVLLVFLGLAVDIAYMYFAKNQLQVAADAAALAGASKLNGTSTDTDQAAARTEAMIYAGNNTAAGVAVLLASDGSNTLSLVNESPGNDITVGNWDPALTPQYLAGRTPVNAVEVRPRRTSGAPLGPVSVFVGKVFRFIGADWSSMSASAKAIAAMPVMANSPFTMCTDACNATYPSYDTTPRAISRPNPSDPFTQMAWTSLLTYPASSSEINKRLLCEHMSFVDICEEVIYTNSNSDAFRNLASVFLDPSTPKTECPPITGITCPLGGTGWWVIVPITEGGTCGSDLVNTATPKRVVSYAFVRITNICPTGCPSGGCPDRPSLPSNCNDIPGCTSLPGDVIVFDRLSCIPCTSIDNYVGIKPFLVK